MTDPDLIRLFIAPLSAGFSGGDFYVPAEETLEEEAARGQGGHFNLIHRETALRADLYLRRQDPLHEWAFERRNRLDVEGLAIWVAPIEYVILRKLEYFRASGSERHLRDVAMMLRISGDSVERQELERWIERLELLEALEEARRYET